MGVGKTTLARLIARCLNCEKGPTDQPCGSCPPCSEITEGRSTDVQEIDAASRTGVDDMREVIESIRYAAAPGKYRIFVIDEVHMLSGAAFNALLKTLEEPPPRSLFVFATTNPEKIPFTVLSRCQRHDLRRIALSSVGDPTRGDLCRRGDRDFADCNRLDCARRRRLHARCADASRPNHRIRRGAKRARVTKLQTQSSRTYSISLIGMSCVRSSKRASIRIQRPHSCKSTWPRLAALKHAESRTHSSSFSATSPSCVSRPMARRFSKVRTKSVPN